MIRKILLLTTIIALAGGNVFAQTNRFEEIIDIDVQDSRLFLTVTVSGTPVRFLFDAGRPTSAILTESANAMGLEISESRASLARVGVGEQLFLQQIAVDVIEDDALQQLGVSGVLGVDIFRQSIVTIDKRDKNITLSLPFKPTYMPLRSRAPMTVGSSEQTVVSAGEQITASVSELLEMGALTLDFTRGRLYFESFETLTKPENLASTAVNPEATGFMTPLNRSMFLRDVFNFREYDEWNFQGTQPAILYFWATWCAPCRRLTPIMEELAKEFDGRVKFYKINFDEEKEVSEGFFNVTVLPTMLFIPMEGEPIPLGFVSTREDVERRIRELME
jgi:thiol-disulfide isomerase/thioredoxin